MGGVPADGGAVPAGVAGGGGEKYPLRRMLRLAFDGFVGFSTAPLRFALALGLFMAAASVLYGIVAIAMKLAGLALVPGYASLLVTITFLSGVQLTVIGIMGQYVARIYDETRARPLYLVRDSRGLPPAHPTGPEMLLPASVPGPLGRGEAMPPS